MVQGLDLDLKCYVHNESFATPKEFDEHCNEKAHTHPFSETLCSDCIVKGIKERVKVDPEEKDKGRIPQARCPGCEDKLLKKLEKKLAKKENKN